MLNFIFILYLPPPPQKNFFMLVWGFFFIIFLYKNFFFSFIRLPWEKPDAGAFIYLFIYLFSCSGIRFFYSLTCDLRDTMPRKRLLPLLPREAEDFPSGDRHFKHVHPLTYLICLLPKGLYVLCLFKRYGYLAMN